MVKVKVCGITRLEDALACFIAGADAVGFVFYKKSPRYIPPEKARKISLILPKELKKVGVFVDEEEKKIKRLARFCRLDMLQFHGKETPEFCRRFSGFKVIKAFGIKDVFELKEVRRYKTWAYLFDTLVKAGSGGTGVKFNWNLLKPAATIRNKVFLSGGLNPSNVGRAIRKVHPAWVDVSSSLEYAAGKKEHARIYRFIKAVRLAADSA